MPIPLAVAASLAGTAIDIGSKAIAAGMGPDADDLLEAQDAAKEVSFAQKQSLSQEVDLQKDKQSLLTEQGLLAATTGVRKNLCVLMSQEDSLDSAAGVTSSDATSAAVDATRTVGYKSYSDTVDNIMKENELSNRAINLDTRKRADAIENELDKEVAAIAETPDTWMEKFFGTSNYKIGK